MTKKENRFRPQTKGYVNKSKTKKHRRTEQSPQLKQSKLWREHASNELGALENRVLPCRARQLMETSQRSHLSPTTRVYGCLSSKANRESRGPRSWKQELLGDKPGFRQGKLWVTSAQELVKCVAMFVDTVWSSFLFCRNLFCTVRRIIAQLCYTI